MARVLLKTFLVQDAVLVLESILNIERKGKGVLHNVYIDLGCLSKDKEKSLQYYELALSAAEETVGRLRACQYASITYFGLGRSEEGDMYLQKSLEYFEHLSENDKLHLHWITMADTFELGGKRHEAIKQYTEVTRPEIELEIHSKLGLSFENSCDYTQASYHHRQALDLSRRLGDKIKENQMLLNLANNLYQLGDYEESLTLAKESLNCAVKMQNKRSEGMACSILGKIYEIQGDYLNAESFHKRYIAISRELGDINSVGVGLVDLSMVYQNTACCEKAIACLKESLEIARERGNEEGEMCIHKNLAETYERQGNESSASLEFAKFEPLARKRNNVEVIAHVLIFRGNRAITAQNPDYDEAFRCLQQAQDIARTIGSRNLETVVLHKLGFAHSQKGNLHELKKCFQEGIKFALEQGDVPAQAKHYLGLGHANFFSGSRFAEAEDNLKTCTELYESIWTKLGSEESPKISIQDEQHQAYELLQCAQISQQKFAEALLTAERGRARAIADVMQNYPLGEQRPRKVEDIQSCVKNSTVLFYSLPFKMNHIYMWVIHPSGSISFRERRLPLYSTDENYLDKQIADLERNARDVYEKLQPRTADSTLPTPPATMIGQLQELTLHSPQSRPPSTVEDCLSGHIMEMYETIERKFRTRDIPQNQRPRANATPPRPSGSDVLYNALIGPVQDLIADSPEIVIVPEGSLNKLPFSALRDQHGRYLSESVRIRVVPSLTTLKIFAKRRLSVKCRRQNILIVGDPNTGMVQEEGKEPERLPFAKQECNMIGEMLHAKPLTGTLQDFFTTHVSSCFPSLDICLTY